MSARIVGLVSLRSGASAGEASEIAQRLGRSALEGVEVSRSHAAVHCEGSVGGGDITLDLGFEDDAACDAFCARIASRSGLIEALGPGAVEIAPAIASVDAARLDRLGGELGKPGLVGIKRTNAVRVLPAAPAERVAQWERDCQLLPRAVPAIRNWCFSRVRPVEVLPTRWTHFWEQEFETRAGLEVDYMMSPYHWGHLDGWYDFEHPKCVIDPWLAHLYCEATDSVLSWAPGRAD